MKCYSNILIATVSTAPVTIVASMAVAQVLLNKDSKVKLIVDYEYQSVGSKGAKDGHSSDWRDWNIRNTVHVIAQYAADAPQPFGAMHSGDSKQQSDINQLQKRANAAQQKMQPNMADMMAIVEKCGETNEACISKAVAEYGMNMEVTPEMKSAQKDIAAINKSSTPRFQLWRLTSQSGNYVIDEVHRKQIFEMTCTTSKVCMREDTRKAVGELPGAANGKSPAGSSMFEVDATNKDLVIALPTPLAPLNCQQTIVTSIPGDKGGVSNAMCSLPMAQAIKPTTISIPGDLRAASGTKTFSIDDKDAGGGKLTVKWKFENR